MLTGKQYQDDDGQNGRGAFPEQVRITLDEGSRGGAEIFCIWMAKVESEFRQALVALVRIDMHGLAERSIDPGRNVAVGVKGGLVSQLAKLRSGSRFRYLRTIGQPARHHLVSDDAQRERVGAGRTAFSEKVFGRRVLHGAENVVLA